VRPTSTPFSGALRLLIVLFGKRALCDARHHGQAKEPTEGSSAKPNESSNPKKDFLLAALFNYTV